MKVQGPNRPNHVEALRNRSTSNTSSAERPATQRGETVTFSPSARGLAEARAPEVPDEARVARLADAIVSGSFKIDASRIADAMLREEL